MPNVEWRGTSNYSKGNSGRLYLFPHICEGWYEGSISTLQNPSRQASAHYVINETQVAQLVKEEDTAWHCGNRWYNWRSISYELCGTTANPPTRTTLDTCAAMMADASRRYFGGAKLELGKNVMLHKMVSNTSCPATTDINYLIAKANEILGQGGSAPTPSAPSTSGSSSGSTSNFGGTYRCNVSTLNVRSYPGLSGSVVTSYKRGQTVVLDNWYTIKDGYVWGRYTGGSSGKLRYVAVGKATGKPEPNDYLIKI